MSLRALNHFYNHNKEVSSLLLVATCRSRLASTFHVPAEFIESGKILTKCIRYMGV